jgi:putative transposase
VDRRDVTCRTSKSSGATYFVTFRSKVVLDSVGRDIVLLEIQRRASREIDLLAAVVMPDHTHLIFRLLGDAKLSQILQLIKGRSSKEINRLLMRRGALWMEESFDRVIRNETDWEQKIDYIKQNQLRRCS